MNQSELSLTLQHKVSNFTFRYYTTYYLGGDNYLFYLESGNIQRLLINSNKGTIFTYNFSGQLTDLVVTDSKTIFAKDVLERLYFMDLELIDGGGGLLQEVNVMECKIAKILAKPILE